MAGARGAAARWARAADGARIAYDVAGEGDDVILLVSPLAGARGLWGGFRDQLAAHARVIGFDHRGLGESSPASLRTTTRRLARDAAAVLDDAEVERAHVFGSSLGGMVATWLAADAASRVGRLVLASTLARGLSFARSGRAALRGARLATCAVRGDRALGRCLAEGLLSSAFAPTLVLRGALDPLVAAEAQRRDFAGLHDVVFDTIDEAGHALALEAPAVVAARILAFFGERPVRAEKA